MITVLALVRSDKKTLKPPHYVQDFPYPKARPQDPISMIRCLLVPKIGSCEHSKNDLLTHGSVILKERTGTEHALFHSTLFLQDERHLQKETSKLDRSNACVHFSEPRIRSLKSDRVNGPQHKQMYDTH